MCACVYVYIYIYAADDLKFWGRTPSRESNPRHPSHVKLGETVVPVCKENSRHLRIPRDIVSRSLFIGRSGYGTSYLGSSSWTLARCRTFTTGVFEDRGGSTAASARFIFIVMRFTPQRMATRRRINSRQKMHRFA